MMTISPLRICFDNYSDERDVNQFLSDWKYVVVRIPWNGKYKYRLYTPFIWVDWLYYCSDIYTKIEHSLRGYIWIFSSYVSVDRICRIVEAKDINIDIDKYYIDRENKELVNKFKEIMKPILSPTPTVDATLQEM